MQNDKQAKGKPSLDCARAVAEARRLQRLQAEVRVPPQVGEPATRPTEFARLTECHL